MEENVIGLTNSQYYSEIAKAIRQKNETQNFYKPSEMAAAISEITTGSDYAVLYTQQELTEEQKQQARENIGAADVDNFATITYVDNAFDNLPIVVDDNYTEIKNMRMATHIELVAIDNKITITTILEGNKNTSSTITLDDNGYPSEIITDGVTCTLEWVGFQNE